MYSHIPLKERAQIRKVRPKVEAQKRKHSVHAFFRKNQKRSTPGLEKYGDLTTAEHRVLNEGRVSRNNHQYAVVVQVLATQWNPCQTKTSQETEKNLRTFTETVEEAKSYSYEQCLLQIGKHCEELSWNHRTTALHKRRDKRNCRMSCTLNTSRDISRIIAIWFG